MLSGLRITALVALTSAFIIAPAAAAPAHQWSGFYLGAVMGYEHQDDELTLIGGIDYGTTNFNGVRVGAAAGFNWIVGPGFLLGIEGDIASHLDQKEGISLTAINFEQSSDFAASIRARAGTFLDDTLVFVTAGYGWDQFTVDSAPFYGPLSPVADDTVGGFVFGFGFETYISDHMSLQVQYLHGEYDDTGLSLTAILPASLEDPSSDSVDISLRWHFN